MGLGLLVHHCSFFFTMFGMLAFLFLVVSHPGEWIFIFFQGILALKPFILEDSSIFGRIFSLCFLLWFFFLFLEAKLKIHILIDVKFIADWYAIGEHAFSQGVLRAIQFRWIIIFFIKIISFRLRQFLCFKFDFLCFTFLSAFLAFFFFVDFEFFKLIVGQDFGWFTDDTFIFFYFQRLEES